MFRVNSWVLLGVLARVPMLVMFGMCWDGFWVHLASRIGFGSLGIELESKEMKKVGSGKFWAGGSATAPTLGRYSAPQEGFWHLGGSDFSAVALGVEHCSDTLFLPNPVLSVFKGF